MYKNGSIQRSNIRTYKLVLKSARINSFSDRNEQYRLQLILLHVECTKMVAFNALKSGHMNLCLSQLNNSFAMFMHNIPYQ